MNIVKHFLLVICILGAIGCTHHYTPRPSRPFEAIPEFSTSNQITLQNAQLSTEEVTFNKYMGHHWIANLKEWTDVAITITKRELTKRGMKVTEDKNTSRLLKLMIESAKTQFFFAHAETQIIMSVETGDGYSADYLGRNTSVMAANIKRQVDGAIMRVVVEMLKDPQIVSYLTK